jgi:predicted CopG family antitoxin
MAIDFDALDLVRTENKDRLYQKKKKALEQLKELLKNYSSDTLIDMIMKESEDKKNAR